MHNGETCSGRQLAWNQINRHDLELRPSSSATMSSSGFISAAVVNEKHRGRSDDRNVHGGTPFSGWRSGKQRDEAWTAAF